MSLYPLRFKPRYVEKMWGGRKIETVLGKALPPGKPIGESWELYDFPPGVVDNSSDWVSAEIANGPLAGRTLHWLVGEFVWMLPDRLCEEPLDVDANNLLTFGMDQGIEIAVNRNAH